MLTRSVIAAAAVLLVAGAAFAAPGKPKAAPKPAAKPAAKVKLVDVKVCPVTYEKVVGQGGGSMVFGKYRVWLCCAGCKPEWDKMTKVEKEQKVAEALKRQKAGTGEKPGNCPPGRKHDGGGKPKA